MPPINPSEKALYITFGNTTQAMNMEEHCGRYGLPGQLVPVPRDIKASCGLAWKTTPEQKTPLEQMMKKEKIRPENFVLPSPSRDSLTVQEKFLRNQKKRVEFLKKVC